MLIGPNAPLIFERGECLGEYFLFAQYAEKLKNWKLVLGVHLNAGTTC